MTPAEEDALYAKFWLNLKESDPIRIVIRAAVAQERERAAKENQILTYERDIARARADKTASILVEIHACMNPPRLEANDGKVMEFVNPNANEMLQAMSDYIRAIPERMAAIDAAAIRKGD